MGTVTIGSTQYQAFATVGFADEYLAADVLRATPWALRNQDTKGRGLVSATRLLQRVGVTIEPDAATIPDVLAEVTVMLAADLLAKPKLFGDASGSSNVKSAKAGSAQVEFFSPVLGGPPIPREFWDLLLLAGLVGALSSAITALDAPFVSGISGDCDRWPYGYFPGRTDDGREGGW